MQFHSDLLRHGVRERVGTIVGSTGPIPVALWTPESTADRLVLVGHGASGTKLEGYVVALARSLARTYGIAVASIDGPVHGDRVGDDGSDQSLPFMRFAEKWSSDTTMTDAMVQDWVSTLDSVLGSGEVSPDAAVGYWGLSMGTILGLPFVAAEPRVRACVLGLMGAIGPSAQRLANDAAHILIPTFYLVQWDDELIPRDAAIALFGQLGANDKTLVVTPGAHGAVTAENFQRSAAFLADRLAVSNLVEA